MKFFCPQMLNTNSLDVFTLNPKATQQRSINMQSVYTYIKKEKLQIYLLLPLLKFPQKAQSKISH